MLSIREVLLAIIDEEGGRISGRTLIQKRAYFLGLLLDRNFGHRPHYYGPYSPQIELALGDLQGLGFVEESVVDFGPNRSGWETKRFDYCLTDDGKAAVRRLKQEKAVDYKEVMDCLKKLRDAGNLDYLTLSVAAKIIYILRGKGKSLEKKEILEEAKTLGWNFTHSPDEAINFLEKIGMVATEKED